MARPDYRASSQAADGLDLCESRRSLHCSPMKICHFAQNLCLRASVHGLEARATCAHSWHGHLGRETDRQGLVAAIGRAAPLRCASSLHGILFGVIEPVIGASKNSFDISIPIVRVLPLMTPFENSRVRIVPAALAVADAWTRPAEPETVPLIGAEVRLGCRNAGEEREVSTRGARFSGRTDRHSLLSRPAWECKEEARQ